MGSMAHMRPSRPELPVDKTWSARENKQAEQSRQRHTYTHISPQSVTQTDHIEAFMIILHSL